MVSPESLVRLICKTLEGKPRLVIAIDGRGGAGKSTLAREVSAAIPGALHFEYDWFHLPLAEVTTERRFDSQRLVVEVLQPFREGASTFEFRRYNWGYLAGEPDGFAEEAVCLRDVSVIVLEGCGVLEAALVDRYDVRVWVDTPADEALARGMRRDIEDYGLDSNKVRSAWLEWSRWEEESLSLDDRRLRADIIVK